MSPKLYTSLLGYSSTLAGFVRPSLNIPDALPFVTALRSVRDIEADEMRVVNEMYIPSIAPDAPDAFGDLQFVPTASVPVSKTTVFDISPSGGKTVTFTVGTAIPVTIFVEVTSREKCLKVDVSDFHGKVLSDSWFGVSRSLPIFPSISHAIFLSNSHRWCFLESRRKIYSIYKPSKARKESNFF